MMTTVTAIIDRRYKGLEKWEDEMSSFNSYIKEHIDIFLFFLLKNNFHLFVSE